jgi:AraC-like DNA-binding protein
MAHLSSLYDPAAGRYPDEIPCGTPSADSCRSRHCEAFWEWLNWGLEQQRADLANYLGLKSADLWTWLTVQAYSPLPPPSALEPERQLFACDIEANLAVLRHEFNWAGNPDWRIRRVFEEADRSSGDVRLRLKELGGALGVSADHLGGLFAERTGVPFRRYLGLLRAVRAVELLRNPDATTASAASALGYADPGNFVKDFRRVLGLAPNAVRTRLLRLDGA